MSDAQTVTQLPARSDFWSGDLFSTPPLSYFLSTLLSASRSPTINMDIDTHLGRARPKRAKQLRNMVVITTTDTRAGILKRTRLAQ